MYGTNAAKGLIPVRHDNGSAWNGQLNSDYRIPNGLNYNIGVGELVFISDGTTTGNATSLRSSLQGYILPWSVYAANPSPTNTNTVAGVFMGCNYPNNNINFPIAGPLGHLSWVAGTTTADSSDAVAFIITDESVVYTAQSSGTTGFTMATANLLQYNFYYQNGVAGTAPGGVLNSDGSCCGGLDLGTPPTGTPAFAPLMAICLDPSLQNPIAAYNNAYCKVNQGTSYASAAAGQHA